MPYSLCFSEEEEEENGKEEEEQKLIDLGDHKFKNHFVRFRFRVAA